MCRAGTCLTVAVMLLTVLSPASVAAAAPVAVTGFASVRGGSVAVAADRDAADTTIVAEGPSSTTLPDGVTWADVRGYIDEQFPDSAVFADAVYDAIRDSGQDYTDEQLEHAPQGVPDSAADVISYFGIDDPDHTTITVSRPLEDGAVLTGVTLLTNVGVLKIADTGSHKSLAFIEDAYEPAGEGELPYNTPEGPAIELSPINLTVLPKRPYEYNLTRSRSGQHFFETTALNNLSVSMLRNPKGKDASVVIDTTLTGRGAPVDLTPISAAGSTESTESPGKTVHPTDITPTFKYRTDPETTQHPTDRVSTKDNTVTMSIPACGDDGEYTERLAFNRLYRHFGGTVEQIQSLDYHYRTSVTYLSAVHISGEAVILGDVTARKIDATNQQPLRYARFRLYEDKAATKPARQADLTVAGQIQRDENGGIRMKETDVADSGEDGVVRFEYLQPGDYYLKEIAPPAGYDLPDPNPVKVTVVGTDGDNAITGPSITGGQGSEAEVLVDGVTGRADNFRNASSWYTATNNITRTSKLDTIRVDDGVYVRNGGKAIAVNDFTASGEGLKPLAEAAPIGDDGKPDLSGASAEGSGYTVTFGDKGDESATTQRFETTAGAQDAINAMIKGRQLGCSTATISVDAGSRVYHRAATDADIVTIGDRPLPVYLRIPASKTLEGGDEAFEDDRFRFTIDGADSRGEIHETVGVKSTGTKLGKHYGVVDFSPLTFDKSGSYEFTITEEVDEFDLGVSYNPEGVSYKVYVDVGPNWLGKFKMNGEPADESDGDEDDKEDKDEGETSDTLKWYQGLAATVHYAKVTSGAGGKPVVGEKTLLGTYDSEQTNVAIKAEDGSITGFTPNPKRPFTGPLIFVFTNVAKTTTLPKTGAGGIVAIAAAGVTLLLVGALIVTHASRRRARR
ncbi:SpaA isopeptide-forming pilin-related protein [Bifidobacterium callitrichos]|nr:SpaA isopeptide-forming pilin-related protein [Bifidobacterium callitrichos]